MSATLLQECIECRDFEGGQFTAEILSSALYYVRNSVSNVNKCSGINTPNVYVNSTKTHECTLCSTHSTWTGTMWVKGASDIQGRSLAITSMRDAYGGNCEIGHDIITRSHHCTARHQHHQCRQTTNARMQAGPLPTTLYSHVLHVHVHKFTHICIQKHAQTHAHTCIHRFHVGPVSPVQLVKHSHSLDHNSTNEVFRKREDTITGVAKTTQDTIYCVCVQMCAASVCWAVISTHWLVRRWDVLIYR